MAADFNASAPSRSRLRLFARLNITNPAIAAAPAMAAPAISRRRATSLRYFHSGLRYFQTSFIFRTVMSRPLSCIEVAGTRRAIVRMTTPATLAAALLVKKSDAMAAEEGEMKKEAKFEDLFQMGLEDLYDAEKQIVAALPNMIAAASSEELGAALEEHLEATKLHVSRLETIFESIAEDAGNRECRPMQALLDAGATLIGALEKSAVLDAGIIAAAQKVEHYEMAGYRAVCTLAEMLGQQDAFDLLDQTLEEEEDADQALTDLGDAILSGDEMEPQEAARNEGASFLDPAAR
jgi:ferritin-like metal-binding protein YciE